MRKITTIGLVLLFMMTAVAVPLACPNGAVCDNENQSNLLWDGNENELYQYEVSGANSQEITDYLRNTVKYDPKTAISASTKCEQVSDQINGDTSKIYTIKYTKKTAESYGSDVLTNTSNLVSTAYPGAILKGNSNLANNTPDAIYLDRTALNYSTTLEVSPSGFTANPYNYSDVKDGITGVINNWKTSGSSLPTSWSMDYTMASSQTQLSVDLGLTIPQLADLGIGVGWESSQSETTFVVEYTQVYYTVSITPKTNPGDYFGEGVSVEDVKNALGTDASGKYDKTQGVVVYSVTYGATVYASLTVSNTSENAKIALEAAICGTEEELSVEQQEILKNAKLKVVVNGGLMPSSESKSMGQLREYLSQNMTVTKDNITTAVPLQYKTIWLNSNDVACSNTTAEYNEKTVIETCSIQYTFHFDGSYVGNSCLRYYTFDGMDAEGKYINERPVEVGFGDYEYGNTGAITIPAYHKPYMYLTIWAVTGDNIVTDYEVCPLYKLGFDHGGSICYQDIDIWVDDVLVYSVS